MQNAERNNPGGSWRAFLAPQRRARRLLYWQALHIVPSAKTGKPGFRHLLRPSSSPAPSASRTGRARIAICSRFSFLHAGFFPQIPGAASIVAPPRDKHAQDKQQPARAGPAQPPPVPSPICHILACLGETSRHGITPASRIAASRQTRRQHQARHLQRCFHHVATSPAANRCAQSPHHRYADHKMA